MEIFVFKIADYNHLGKEELKQWQKKEISNPEKLREHCLAYYLAEKTANEYYGFKSCEIIYKGKKPVLKNNEKAFSISHSKEFIALGFSDSPCGIDIEKLTERDFLSIAERMKFECPNLETFYKIWTKYEAQYKLGKPAQSEFYTQIENYALTAVSANKDEVFKIV